MAIWRSLGAWAANFTPRTGARVEMDLSAVPAVDGDVMAMLVEVCSKMGARGVAVELTGMREPVAKLAQLYAAGQPAEPGPRAPRESAIARVGAATSARIVRTGEALAFLGSLARAAFARRLRGRTPRWDQVVPLVEEAGARAMAIVFPFIFIIGFIFSYATATEFKQLGQRLLSPRILGRAMCREIAPVMTAMIVSGRSGAAYAAQIGSMKIDHEIDALRTLGLEPLARLVIPRAIALTLVVPALVIVADFFGFAGGAVVGVTSLGLELPVYVHALRDALGAWSVISGLIKAAAFGVVIALVSCQQGFAVSMGPEEVGRRTTSAVVAAMFLTVLTDAVFTVVYQAFGG